MPLGKLSRKQIESAYAILSEAQTMVKEGSGSDPRLVGEGGQVAVDDGEAADGADISKNVEEEYSPTCLGCV